MAYYGGNPIPLLPELQYFLFVIPVVYWKISGLEKVEG
jgi:hypothetical protein